MSVVVFDPPNLELLIKLMKMTTSATDGEALAAIRMANKQLAMSGGDWELLLRGKLATIDPFASLPEPPKAQPYAPWPRPAQPTTPPPPPTLFGADPKEAKTISTWIVTCEFATLDHPTTMRISHIITRWNVNKRLDGSDYNFLKTTAAKVKRGRP